MMTVYLCFWRWKIKKTLVIVSLFAVLIIVIVLIYAEIRAFGTGFDGYDKTTTTSIVHGINIVKEHQPGKTLWDWLQLLIIPVVLAVGGFIINLTLSRTEREITENNQRETALQAYIDKISELLLKEHLAERTEDGQLNPEYEQVRKIARVRTLTVLEQLDGKRKRSVLQFLYESDLINKDRCIIDLGAGAAKHLLGADLNGAFLIGLNLSGANLRNVKLRDANLIAANLSGADLYNSDLSGADLSGADLSGATITREQLKETKIHWK